MPEEGKKAPLFCLRGIDKDGVEAEFSLAKLLKEGRPMILYFYPKDNTPGCTTEACDFRDNMNRLTGIATVVGVSRDSIASHLKFREQHGLNFILLTDPDHKVMEAYGAWGEKTSYGKTTEGVIRSTYIIGTDGKVKKQMLNVKAKGHVDRVLEEMGKL
ncbi:MAG: peroxiredoxin [Nitrospirae bacterium]|nr:peroxiredoxin [Nitrospirota bacterium]MBI5694963.1 peroxiredoxin [Nitrospirota bacterium]